MKRHSSNFMLLLFLIIPFPSSPQQCGISNIFKREIELTREIIVSSTENLPAYDNGTKMTIYGWFLISTRKDLIPLFRLKFFQNIGETQPAQSLSEFIKVTYQPGQQLIEIQYARGPSTWESVKIDSAIPLQRQIFFSVSFDVSLSILNLYFQGENYLVEKRFVITYPEFFVRTRFQVDIGCFVEEGQNLEELSETCMIGSVRDWNYLLDFFNESLLIKFLSNEENPRKYFFVFDEETKQTKL